MRAKQKIQRELEQGVVDLARSKQAAVMQRKEQMAQQKAQAATSKKYGQ